MKKIVIASAILLLAACKKNETTAVKDGVATTETTTDAAKVQEQTQDELDKIDVEKLKNATPATKEQLQSVLPAEVNGLPKVPEQSGGITMQQKQTAAATYMKPGDPSNMYMVIVVDAAGQDATKYQAEFEKFKNSEVAKDAQANSKVSSEVINGNRVFFNEMDMSGTKATGANFMAKGRYAVVISGSGLTKETAKDVISKMDLSKLPD